MSDCVRKGRVITRGVKKDCVCEREREKEKDVAIPWKSDPRALSTGNKGVFRPLVLLPPGAVEWHHWNVRHRLLPAKLYVSGLC